MAAVVIDEHDQITGPHLSDSGWQDIIHARPQPA
jgi:hypothetical protein